MTDMAATAKPNNVYVMVKQIEDHKHIVPRWTVSAGLWDMYLWVDDVDDLYKQFVERKSMTGCAMSPGIIQPSAQKCPR
jgi:hypothetical protein